MVNVIVRQFLPSDLMLLSLQPHQRAVAAEVATADYGNELAKHGDSFTVYHDSDILAVIGLINQWEGCARAYAFLSADAGRHMLTMTRKVRAYLDACPIRRIEAAVQDDFEAGHRWVNLLGFKVEGWMRKYWNDHDALLYARVQ